MEFILNILKETWYIWVLLIIVKLLKPFSPKIKGYFGEKSVANLLAKLDPAKYKVINNIMLQVGARTSQIDHVVVSNYGIFVIETKNYDGWIIGNEYDDNWKQVIYKRKEKMPNPIKQNHGHIKALKEALSEHPDVNYASIVAFTTKANLKVKVSANVVYTVDLLRTIRKYSDETISDSEKEQMYSKLLSLNVDSKEFRKAHVQAIHNNLKDRDSKINSNICPRCGGDLVQRNGKNGLFKGCGNYPKCRFIVK